MKLLTICKGKIHRATVTQCDVDYVGSVTVDADLLDAAGIIVNKNAVPYDEKPPAVASGIRLGTPIVSTRGMRETEMKEIVELVDRVLRHRQEPKVLEEVRAQAKALCARFPMFHSY